MEQKNSIFHQRFFFFSSCTFCNVRWTKHSRKDNRGCGGKKLNVAVSGGKRTVVNRYAHVENDSDNSEVHKWNANDAESESE